MHGNVENHIDLLFAALLWIYNLTPFSLRTKFKNIPFRLQRLRFILEIFDFSENDD